MIGCRVLVVAALVAAATSLAPVPAASASDCEDGVIVVVDASGLGRGISQTCVAGAPGNGLDALRAAGHTYGFVPRIPGMVCTIDDRPDPCNGAPAHAYWSYWHAEQGGSWSYSSVGAGDHHPTPGTVEGWRFGDGAAPGIPPPGGEPEPDPEEPEPKPEPEPEPEPEEPSSGDAAGSGSSSGGSSTEPGSDAPSSSGSTSPPSEDAVGADEVDDDTDRSDGDDRTIDPAEPATDVPVDGTAGYRAPDASAEAVEDEQGDDEVALPDRDDGSAPVGLVVGGGLVTGLAALTALQVRRRRLEG